MIETKGNVKDITGAGFRLVHDRGRVVALIEGTERTITSTLASRAVKEFKERLSALDEISKLSLEFDDGTLSEELEGGLLDGF